MANWSINIVVGVFSGVLSSLFLFILYKLKNSIFDPWLENRLYKGVVLEGSWSGKRIVEQSNKDGTSKIAHELNINMQLKQTGYRITGIFSAESIRSESDKYTNLYSVTGHIHDNYMVLEYCPLSRKRTGLGAFVMQVKNGGKQMKGSISFVEETNMEVTALNGAILNRKDEE